MSDDLKPIDMPEDAPEELEDIVEQPSSVLRRVRRRKPEVEPEVEVQPEETDEEILLDGAGDEEFLQYALQYKDRPGLMGRDFKFLTRLAARRARRSGDITAAEHKSILDLIRNPVRMRGGKPYDAWGEFETKIRAEMPKSGFGDLDWTEIWKAILTWFKENWPTILKVLLTVLMMLDPPRIPRRKRHWRNR